MHDHEKEHTRFNHIHASDLLGGDQKEEIAWISILTPNIMDLWHVHV